MNSLRSECYLNLYHLSNKKRDQNRGNNSNKNFPLNLIGSKKAIPCENHVAHDW